VDLGPLVGHDFSHLDHMPAWLTWLDTPRVENNVVRTPEDPPPEHCPTGPDWELARYRLDLEAVPVRLPVAEARWRASRWPALAWAGLASTVQTLLMLVRDNQRARGRMRGIAYVALVSSGVLPRLRRMRGAAAPA
jgi:hypothetical protein